ncbi:hypothetical protein [Megasphaera sp.]|uniref:hypothetical protein n=1 Tax=Megasphaera sp. TaxID=2023260 RepID=UPI00266E92AF|nr:hypothetical protein [uncultured Megasphaera sp.]
MDYLTYEDVLQLSDRDRKKMHVKLLTGNENIGPLEKYGRHGFFDGKEVWETREPIDTDRIYQRGGVYIYQRKPLTDFILGSWDAIDWAAAKQEEKARKDTSWKHEGYTDEVSLFRMSLSAFFGIVALVLFGFLILWVLLGIIGCGIRVLSPPSAVASMDEFGFGWAPWFVLLGLLLIPTTRNIWIIAWLLTNLACIVTICAPDTDFIAMATYAVVVHLAPIGAVVAAICGILSILL